MTTKHKLHGIIPAFYACYDENNNISTERCKEFANYLISKGANGLYVGGSSGECIYLTVEDRKVVLEAVMEVAKGKIPVIAHVACNGTKDSMELARHAESLGVDAIAAIPPIYFKLPEHAIAKYWNDISSAAPNTDFIIYNIPQLAGVALSTGLLEEMLKNPKVIGVKNSSMPIMDLLVWKQSDCLVFNGPDEQFVSGLAAGVDGGIGGTYAFMIELFIAAKASYEKGDMKKAQEIQHDILKIIQTAVSGKSNMYAVAKESLKIRAGLELGSVMPPLPALFEEDRKIVDECVKLIEEAIAKINK